MVASHCTQLVGVGVCTSCTGGHSGTVGSGTWNPPGELVESADIDTRPGSACLTCKAAQADRVALRRDGAGLGFRRSMQTLLRRVSVSQAVATPGYLLGVSREGLFVEGSVDEPPILGPPIGCLAAEGHVVRGPHRALEGPAHLRDRPEVSDEMQGLCQESGCQNGCHRGETFRPDIYVCYQAYLKRRKLDF